MNASQLTAIRTAAASALSVKAQTRLEARQMAIFGAGMQAEWHGRLIAPLLPRLEKIYLVNRSRASQEKLLENLKRILPPQLEYECKLLSNDLSNVITSCSLFCLQVFFIIS